MRRGLCSFLLALTVLSQTCRSQSKPFIIQLIRAVLEGPTSSTDDPVDFPQNNLKCTLCRRALTFIKNTVQQSHQYRLDAYAKLLCVFLSATDVIDPILANDTSNVDVWIDLCEHAYNAYKPFVVTILERSNLTGLQMCQMMNVCPGIDASMDWNVELSIPRSVSRISSSRFRVHPGYNSVLRVLQLSDIHIQKDYVPGSEAVCGRPVCCSGPKIANPARQAGYFGDYRNCDLPVWTFLAILEHIAEKDDVDVIYFTGDGPSHQIWNQSSVGNIRDNIFILRKLREIFPDIPIYATLGNHENWPCNMYAPRTANSNTSDSLYKSIANEWKICGKLPQAAVKTIEKSGVYTILIRPKLRLISLNTNFAVEENFWLYLNPVDPDLQLNWLVRQLTISENRNETVHIIGHHYPGKSLQAWSANYYNIVKRFNKTIKAQFFGHEHQESFSLFFDESNLQPFSSAYIAPSLTTFPDNDPAYKIFTVGLAEKNYGSVIDMKTKVMNLSASNIGKETVFYEDINLKDELRIEDLSLSSLSEVLRRSRSNNFKNSVMEFLIRRRYHSVKQTRKCGYACRKSFACSMAASKRNWTIWC